MRKTFLLLCCILIGVSLLPAQTSIDLSQALARKWVAVRATGLGGFHGVALELALKNNHTRPLAVRIPAGWIFASKDSAVQDLMVTHPVVIQLPPGRVGKDSLRTVCTQRNNMGPVRAERFNVGQMAEEGLLRLAQIIAQKRTHTGAAQMAVWALADRRGLQHLSSSDTTQTRQLAAVVATYTGTAPAEITYSLIDGPQLTTFRTSLEALLPEDVAEVRLMLTDETGEVVQQYFQDRTLEAGFVQFRVGVNHWRGTEANLQLRLMAGDRLLMEKAVSPQDSVMPLKRVRSRAQLSWQATAPLTSATVGVYDTEGQLYFWLSRDYAIEAGRHTHHFLVGKHLPMDKAYVVQVKHADTLIAEGGLDIHADQIGLHAKRKVAGVFQFRQLTEANNLQLGVYDTEGTLQRVLLDIHHLNPGEKRMRYQFEHWDGAESRFLIRLTDPKGDVLAEKKIKG